MTINEWTERIKNMDGGDVFPETLLNMFEDWQRDHLKVVELEQQIILLRHIIFKAYIKGKSLHFMARTVVEMEKGFFNEH